MTRTIPMSVAEIQRVGVWALRALGYGYGTAERGAKLIAAAEAYGDHGLRLLREGEQRIRASHASSQRRQVRSDEGYRIAAAGRCLVEVGPTAVDLGCSVAVRQGSSVTVLEGAFGSCLIPALCGIAARRNMAVAAVFSSDAEDPRMTGAPAVGIAVQANVDGTRLAWTGPSEDHAGFAGAIAAVGLRDFAPLIDQIASSTSAATERDPSMVVFVMKPIKCRANFGDGPVEPTLISAYENGIAADIHDFMQLYRLERSAWAPSSDRSHQQAAF